MDDLALTLWVVLVALPLALVFSADAFFKRQWVMGLFFAALAVTLILGL